MEEDQNNQEDNLNNNNNENNSLINRGAQDLQKNLQDQMKKNAKKKAASAGTKAKSAAAMGPVIFWTVVVIVAIIILVGIIMFFMTMPGMVMDKLKLLGKSIINSVLSFFGQDESTFVDDEQIYQVLDYLEEMGYDLKGFGFLTDYVDGEATGVKREEDESGEEKITEAYSDFVKRYIISDNYIYIIKNKNLSTNWLDALWQHLGHLFGSPYSQESTRGLIAIYKETGLGRADENNLFSDLGAMSVDTDKKVLYLTKDNQHYVAYNLDGWIGRYGMPLEFLLSVHVATMMPDLAFDMADTFSTNVNIYLRDVEATESGTPSFEAYMPYIATVTNHWYRNVYYVVDLTKMNTGTQDENQTLVSYDYDYEKMYGDRWTIYEVYTDEDTQTGNQDYNEYATDNINGFKLYVLSETGEYATSSTLPEAASNNSKVISDTKYSDYFVYIGSKEEANDARITVSKKAISLSTEKDLEDIGWNNLGDNIWSAYLETVSMHSGDNEGKKTYNKRNNSDTAGSITQTGEGQRGETNSKIKKMFLINTYFRYNGTTDTAEIVTALRNKLKKDKLGSDVVSYGALNALHDSSGNETDLTKENIEYTASELGLDENKFPGTYNIKDYSGQVSLNQDSLNAFSMLENIHTLDADYIYRDFKELIVELGYFTKEELTDEAPRVLGWIVPDISSFENYPERYLDKSEESFGTLMHSKGDVYAKRYMELDLAGYKKDRDSLSRYDFDPKTLFNRWWNYMYPTILTEGKTADEFVEKVQEMWDYMSEKGYSVSGGELLNSFEESKEQNNYSTSRATFVAWALISMDTKFYNYCSKRSREVIELDSYKMVDDGNGGQKPQLDSEGKPVHDTRYRSIHRLDDVANISVNRLCGRIITDFNELRKGDLIAFIDNGADDVTGLDILGDKKNGTFVRYTAEKDINKGDKPPQDFDENEFYNTSKYKSCFGIRIFEGSEYNGYEGNEMVASPVTGILLEYGTYDETNIDSITQEQYRVNTDLKYPFALKTVEDTIEGEETQSKIVSDKVGYAKILILDKENYSYIEQSTSNRWNISEGGTSLLAENGTYREELVDDDESKALDKTRGTDRWDDMDQTIYSYKEWAELYEQAGIAGNILYIDGFVCEEPDDDVEDVTTTLPKGEKITLDTYKKISESTLAGKSITEAQEMQLKSGWRDYNLYVTQSEKTNHKFEAEVRAKMRAYNSLYIDKVTDKQGQQPEGIDSLIVIKEGTILGRTMTDKELLESENFRNGSMGTYEQNREFQDWQKVDGKDRIIGNYLRMIMRDKDDTPVEDVERFFKDSIEEKLDWFELWFYTPMSSMATDEHLWGPEAIGSMYPGQLSVGLVQETDKQYPYWNSDGASAIEKFLYKCWLLDDDLCARLEDFFGYKTDDFWAFAEGGKVFGRHHGLFYYLQEGTLYYPIAGYQSGTPCIYSDGSATPFSRTSRVRWGGVIYETFNDFIAAMGSSIAYAAGDDHAENQTIQILDADDNVIGSGLLLFIVDGASLAGGGEGYFYGESISGTVYTDATGYMLEYPFETFYGPQRSVDHSVYVGDGKEVSSANLHSSDLQKALTYISDIDREKFVRIQREAAKETYLDEIIDNLPWIKYRPAVLQSALITLPVSGSEAYKSWPASYEFESDDVILDQIAEDKSKVRSMGTDPHGFTPDPTSGHAWSVPEIARKYIKGALKKYELQDFIRYYEKALDVLAGADVDYRAEK